MRKLMRVLLPVMALCFLLGSSVFAATPKLKEVNGKTYYITSKGKRGSGWKTIDGKKYYFDKKTEEMVTGWQTIGRKQYYFKKTGEAATGWTTIKGYTYYFRHSNCAMKKGILKLSDGTYFLNPKTGVRKKGWRSYGGNTYYFDGKTYTAVKGWKTIKGKTYYFEPETGVLCQNKAVNVEGDMYYFGSDGAMAVGKRDIYIRRVCYTAGEDGILTEQEENKVQKLARKKLDEIGWSLKKAFLWSASIKYLDVENNHEGYTFAEWNAYYGFKKKIGDCHVMAATFYYMAKALGYDAHLMKGRVPLRGGGYTSHGWVEIDINGETWVFDPDLRNDVGKGGFKFKYKTPGTWMYDKPRRVN